MTNLKREDLRIIDTALAQYEQMLTELKDTIVSEAIWQECFDEAEQLKITRIKIGAMLIDQVRQG